MSDFCLLEVKNYSGLKSPAGQGCLALSAGDLCLLQGESGAGKSSLLKCLVNLLPFAPAEIRFNSRSVLEYGGAELRRRVGFLAQEPPRFSFTGKELIARVRSFKYNQTGLADMTQVEEWVDILELKECLDRDIPTYSGGENKRLALLCLLQLKPEVLLLDEPTNGLDPRRVGTVSGLINLELSMGKTVIWASHEVIPEDLRVSVHAQIEKQVAYA